MAIPKEILEVERPKSTRVKFFNGTYYVIKRTSEYRNGKAYPVELGTIGKIENGKYVEIRKEPRKRKKKEIDIKEYGTTALAHKVGSEILDDLKEFFDVGDANKIYITAMLRAVNQHITSRTLKCEYDTSYISEIIPKVAVSESTISRFLQSLGKGYLRMQNFMAKRVANFTGNVVIDGMLKDSNGHNSFNEFSRKARTKGSKDISLMYAYDFGKKEPLAMQIFPGNMLDLTSFKQFINNYSFKNSMLIMDKGFYCKENISLLQEKSGVSYVIPIKRNSAKFKDFIKSKCINEQMPFRDENLLCGKKKLADGTFLYGFKNLSIASQQIDSCYERMKKEESFNIDNFEEKERTSGIIVFESKSDLDCYSIYEAYSCRWEIETMFNLYKNILRLDTVNVQNDYSIIATEFINFISMIIGSRIKNYIRKRIPTSDYSMNEIMLFLTKCKMVKDNNDKWNKFIQVKTRTDIFSLLDV